jgi:regulator of RNase E activity RraB
MSNEWEFFPCQIGDHIAFIFFDYGARKKLPERGLNHVTKIQLKLKLPREDGLTTNEEFELLRVLEQDLGDYCTANETLFVGRITWQGRRDFYVYTNTPNECIADLKNIIEAKHNYEAEYLTYEDPEFEAYWKELYPTKLDWQVIMNRHTIERLEEHGDKLEKERRINHWLCFNDVESRSSFVEAVQTEGYFVESIFDSDEDDSRFSLQIYHYAIPDFQTMNHFTISLLQKASEFNGEYDGWETSVEK